MSAISLDLVLQSKNWGKESVWSALFTSAAQKISAVEGFTQDMQVCVLLSDDAHIRVHNKQWRGKDKATNVLSFPAAQIIRDGGFLGDLILSFETLQREAIEQDKTLEHHAQHLFVHGLLHLLGYDHEIEVDAVKMEALEHKILLELGAPPPYE